MTVNFGGNGSTADPRVEQGLNSVRMETNSRPLPSNENDGAIRVLASRHHVKFTAETAVFNAVKHLEDRFIAQYNSRPVEAPEIATPFDQQPVVKSTPDNVVDLDAERTKRRPEVPQAQEGADAIDPVQEARKLVDRFAHAGNMFPEDATTKEILDAA